MAFDGKSINENVLLAIFNNTGQTLTQIGANSGVAPDLIGREAPTLKDAGLVSIDVHEEPPLRITYTLTAEGENHPVIMAAREGTTNAAEPALEEMS